MIPYNYDDIAFASQKDLLITDGTVTVSGTSYSVASATVTITNDLLESEAFELHQSLCSEMQLLYGSCESGYITFVMHDNIPTIKDKTLKVYLIPDSDASKMLQLGVFKVVEDKLSSDRKKRTITAYDAMYDILNADVAAWYNSELPNSSSSETLATFRASFLTHFGITAESTTLVNDSITIKRTIEPQSLSGADVIKAICELNGVFGTITYEGKFRYVELAAGLDAGLFPSDDLYPANDLYPQDVNHNVTTISKDMYIGVPQFEDWNSEAITQLTIRENDEDVGKTVGTSGNSYVITGNFLLFGYSAADLQTVATNALTKMENRYYRPASVEAVGNPLHEVGDGIRIQTKYRGIVTYILMRTLKGIQSLRDTYSANGQKKHDEQLNSSASRFTQLSSKTTTIKADVDGFKVEVSEDYVSKDGVVTDLNAKMSGIEIQSNAIKVYSTGTFTVDATNFKLAANGTATIKNATITDGTLTISPSGVPELQAKIYSGVVEVSFSTTGYSTKIDGSGITVKQSLNQSEVLPTGINLTGGISVGTDAYVGGVLTIGGSIAGRLGYPLHLYGASNSTRISLDASGSAYNIVLDGSVNMGNGSSNTIRIKGRDVKWVKFGTIGADDYVLVEA